MRVNEPNSAGFVPPASAPSPARMYDYYLGGKDNFAVDREAAEKVLSLWPETEKAARANRRFLVRAVRFLAEQGIDQYIDLGTGIPTPPNVHEVAREIQPGARVAYVDNDQVVTAHNRALRARDGIACVDADLRDPDAVLGHPELAAVIDFDRPVALLFLAVLHFIGDDAADLLARYRAAVVPGSYMTVSIATMDGIDAATRSRGLDVYDKSTSPVVLRGRSEVVELLSDVELVDPGLVPVTEWRTDEPPLTAGGLAGVGRIG